MSRFESVNEYLNAGVDEFDVMRPLGSYLTQAAAKDSRGICICQDADYRDAYQRKYAGLTTNANRTVLNATEEWNNEAKEVME